MAQDIPICTQWNLSDRACETLVFEMCDEWLMSPHTSKLSPDEDAMIQSLRNASDSEVMHKTIKMLEKTHISHLEEIREQIHCMLLAWEWAIRAKKRFDSSIKPFLEEELVECIGPKHFLACVQIISKRATVISMDEAPPARDEAPPVPRQKNLSESKDEDNGPLEKWTKYRENNSYDPEDESKEPLERWKYFKKQLGSITSVAGSSKEGIHNRPLKRKKKRVLSENSSDASEHSNQFKHKRVKKETKEKKKVNEDHGQDGLIKEKRK